MENKTGKIGAIALLTGAALGVLGMWTVKKNGFNTYVDVTPDTSTLMDSLEGINVDGSEADLIKVRVLGLERAKLVAMWGSKGLNHDEPTKFQRFIDLTTEHLMNIRNNSEKVTENERLIIASILEDRVAAGEADEDVLGV